MGCWAMPEEITNGILFLATEDSSYITGSDLRIDEDGPRNKINIFYIINLDTIL